MRISTMGMFSQSLNNILDQHAKTFDVQKQLSSGKRVNSPTDDPLVYPTLLAKRQSIETVQQYQRNIDLASNRLTLQENSISNSVEILQRIRDLLVQGASSTLQSADRVSISQEVQMRLDELVGIANSRGASGEYVFSGFKTNTKPVTQSGGNYSYNGDQGQNHLQISSSLTIPVSDNGYDVFFDIFNGNGNFVIDEGVAANNGGARISVGSVVDQANYNPSITSTITFADAGDGSYTYSIDNPAVAATPYIEGSAISFNGIEVEIDGTPDAGDTFRIQRSSRQSVFETLATAVTNLRKDSSTEATNANFVNSINVSLSELDLAIDHLIDQQTQIGARLSTIESEKKFNEFIAVKNEEILSGLEDVDLAESVAKFNQLKLGLESAYSAFAQIQNLSLMNLIN